MLELFKYCILIFAIAATMLSRRWGIAVFAFFLPLTQWLPDVPIPGVNALNLMLLPLVIRAVTAGGAKGARRGEPLAIPMAVMLAAWTYSWLRVQLASALPEGFVDEGGLYGNLVTYKEFVVDLIMYYCARRLVRGDDAVRRIVIGIVGGFMFEAVTAAREFLFSGSWRATAHMAQPNKLGDFLSSYVMLPMAWVLDRLKGWAIPGLIGTTFALLGLMGAVSRGALLAMGAAAIACATLRRSAWIVVVAAAIGTAPMWLPQKFMDRFEGGVVESDSGGVALDTEHEGRFGLWAAGRAMIADQPLLGVGLNMYPFHLREYGYEGRKLKSSHNIYIQLSAEQGIPCAIAHTVMMLTILWIAWQVASRAPGSFQSAIGLGMFGATVAFIVGTGFGDGFYENNLSGGFWLGAGALVSLWKSEPTPADIPNRGSQP